MQGAADRLAVKLASLDLDDDEQAVLREMLAVGASSVETGDDEVAGFAIVSYRPQSAACRLRGRGPWSRTSPSSTGAW